MPAVPNNVLLSTAIGLKPPRASGNPTNAETWAFVYGSSGSGAAHHTAEIGLQLLEQAYFALQIQAPDGTWGARTEETRSELFLHRHGPGRSGPWANRARP